MNMIQFVKGTFQKNSLIGLLSLSASVIAATTIIACKDKTALSYKDPDANIIFLHHSTGSRVWNGGSGSKQPAALKLMETYNEKNAKKYAIAEQAFPKNDPYGWNNYPYDYYNIWVKNGGDEKFKDEPTLEILTKQYDVIIFKHCFPVSNVLEDTGKADIDSDIKRLENYKLQYNALKDKMKSFAGTKFIVWTSAALTEGVTTKENAERSQEFVNWVKEEWDEDGDNIFLFDFWTIETEGGLYMKEKYATSEKDPHPNGELSEKASKLFINRVIDIIENNGNKTTVTGEQKA